ncbi:Myb-like_DNA-binding domain-containing protein [Hexamita inflata]|uniref:Myb-like DNA-binding domain-containing protein n=1 Tax=Hexamita inflata TaxID=28002 RepID=A0AA86U6U3_9EUKA|nr:Myb-like DNA-binding domain-containing protein [Hexamita inflata]
MKQSTEKNKYNVWTDQEIQKLSSVVQRISMGKTYTNWHRVAEEMAPRTLQQCKSYYGQLTNLSGTLANKFKKVVQQQIPAFNANTIFMQQSVEKQILLYTLPVYHQFDFTKVQEELSSFSLSELKELFTAAQNNINIQKQVMNLISNGQFEQFSVEQLKLSYNNFTQLEYCLQLEELRLKNVDSSQIPTPPVSFDGYTSPVVIRYPPQQHLVQYFKELIAGLDIQQILLNLVIKLSHGEE